MGLMISYNNNELVLKGDKLDLIELSNYVRDVALKEENNHMHIDELTLIDKKSTIKNLIIEKKDK